MEDYMAELNEQENKIQNEIIPIKHSFQTKNNFITRCRQFITTILLAAVVGGASGYVVSRHTNLSPTIYQSNQASPSKLTSVKNNVGLSLSQAAKKASPSVVEIATESNKKTYGFLGGEYSSKSMGSGVIISKDGYIITNHHVVAGANSITITTHDGTSYEAKLIGSDAKSDIAVLKVKANNLTPATLGDSSKISIGDTAMAIGNPLGTLGGTVTDGIISATSRSLIINNEAMDLIQTNATINSGNSGGGLFDGNGNLIGIVNAKDSGTTSSGATIEGLGFAIPINKAMEVAKDIIKNGKVTSRATIGVTLQTIPEDIANIEKGVYIRDVLPGSGAQKAGLLKGDRILKADDKKVEEYSDIAKLMKDKKVGDTIKFNIMRDHKEKEITVKLGPALNIKEK